MPRSKVNVYPATVHICPDRYLFFFDEGRFGLQSILIHIWAKRGNPLLQNVL